MKNRKIEKSPKLEYRKIENQEKRKIEKLKNRKIEKMRKSNKISKNVKVQKSKNEKKNSFGAVVVECYVEGEFSNEQKFKEF